METDDMNALDFPFKHNLSSPQLLLSSFVFFAIFMIVFFFLRFNLRIVDLEFIETCR